MVADLRANWKGHEKLQLEMLHGKNKYGNGIDAVDLYAEALANPNSQLQLNLAAFYYDYQDFQARLFVNNASRVENAADTEIMGLEIEGIWVTDIGHHVVFKFSPQGKLLLALGRSDKPGLGDDQFDQPTDVAFGPQGEIYVSDGYGNSRVMKFASNGKFLTKWGKPGKGRLVGQRVV